MTSTNDSSGAMPTEEAKPNWVWLQEKVHSAAVAQLDDWLTNELTQLEETFAEYITP